MTLLPISQCENNLDLPRKSAWQEPLPPLAVNGLLVTPLSNPAPETVVSLSADLATTLHALYPSASWYELLRLRDSGRFDEDSWTSFLGLYGMRWNDDLKKTLPLRFPRSIEERLSEKDLGPREVAPLLLLSEPSRLKVLEWIFSSAATRSQTSRLIELISEVAAMEGNSSQGLQALRDQFKESPPIPDLWVKKLEAVRFPQTFRRDQERVARLKSLDLPLRVTADHKRLGDETSVELKISARAPGELKRILDDLSSKPWENAWKSH